MNAMDKRYMVSETFDNSLNNYIKNLKDSEKNVEDNNYNIINRVNYLFYAYAKNNCNNKL